MTVDAKSPKRNQRANRTLRRARRHALLPAVLAGGACALTSVPANAVQLGEIDVYSSIGQPLRASIAFALSPNEQLGDYCIFLKPGPLGSGIPALRDAQLTVANGRINILGRSAVREPMLDVRLAVNCPYTANLTRSYTVLLDPFEAPAERQTQSPAREPALPAASRVPEMRTQRVTQPEVSRPQATTQTQPVRQTATPGPQSRTESLPTSGQYRVQVGDSLSEIAARIENRPVGLWQAVEQLFAANPHAFIDGDINKLKAGSVLNVPAFDGRTVSTVQDVIEPASAPASPAATAYAGVEDIAPPTVDTATESLDQTAAEPVAESAAAPVENPIVEPAPTAQVDSPQPGDVQITDSPSFVAPIEAPAATAFEVPSAEGVDSAADETAAPSAVEERGTGWMWLAGSGLALIALLLLFGRRGRNKLGAPGAAVATAAPAEETQVEEAPVTDVDFEVDAQGSTEYAVALDADLNAGTGLSDSNEIEVAQDFGFSATHGSDQPLDLTLTEDTAREEEPSTDVLPVSRVSEETILEKEILPGNADDDYDMSMIVDATKQKFGEGDVTAKDLMAVALAESGDDEDSEEYTLSREIDYKILEQDYEDELTATQAMNAEIERAAKELADRLDETSETLAVTAETTAICEVDDDPEIMTDLDDTGVNELTAEMPQRGVSAVADATTSQPVLEDECDDDTAANTEITEKLPAAENDPTAEMEIESGRVRSGGSKG
ncbi:MAG: hypothetical protein AAF417_19030 [Pseudomonadota bacterium]